MNAQTSIAPHPPAYQAYGPALDAVMPGKVGEERRIRCGMLLMRDRAIKARQYASWEADQVLSAVQHIAMERAFQPMALTELRELHYNLVRLVASASNLQSIAEKYADGD